jgi:hypothetical protein
LKTWQRTRRICVYTKSRRAEGRQRGKNYRCTEEQGVCLARIEDKICLGPFKEEELPWEDILASPVKVE